MKILVTGAAGFIGQHLMEALAAFGFEPVGVDRAEGDLREPGVFVDQLEEYQPDVVIHLAAQVGRLFGEDDLIRTVNSNAQMTTLVAKACGDNNVRLLYASTSEAYGDYGNSWADEWSLPSLPHNLYGLTKRWGEEVCQLYAPKGLVMLRFSMPYGPGVVPGRGRAALLNVLWQANTNQPIPVHRGAERSWCWIGDTCRAVCMILASGDVGVFNVGRSDNPISMYDLALRACYLTGASPDLIQQVEPPGPQTIVKRLATQRIEALGWEPTVSLEEGMVRVLKWVEQFDENGQTKVVV